MALSFNRFLGELQTARSTHGFTVNIVIETNVYFITVRRCIVKRLRI